jgi:hypothetical protein
MMKQRSTIGLVAVFLAQLAGQAAAQTEHRPPAVPLVAHDPYFSVWSVSDQLAGESTRHWTGAPHTLTSLVRIDGKTYRLMGKDPRQWPALPQTGVRVHPTRTVYTFEGSGAKISLTFTTPTLPHEIETLSRPATYISWEARSTDGRPHQASVYFDAGAELTVNSPDQTVSWDKPRVAGLNVVRSFHPEPRVLGRSGDNLRIDWGSLYVAAPSSSRSAFGPRAANAAFFAAGSDLPLDAPKTPRAASDGSLVSAVTMDLGRFGSEPAERHLILAYDDEYSITYFGRKLRPYWRRKGDDAADLLRAAERDYPRLKEACRKFDEELESDLTRVGGEDYAYIGSLAFRQSFAAQKVVADAAGHPLMFSKENFSNGCIATVDVLYPAAPILLLFSPSLMKASLVPILDYSASPRWRFPFAPHDLGTYPLANGQVYGGGELTEDNQMPVEETGNMLILLAALAKREGNADFAKKYQPQLSKWAAYLADKGFDPESQLSTDDFAGHLAHNVNLSAKAIVALAAYGQLSRMQGLEAEATRYRGIAEEFAARWVKEAADGDHTKLAFDKPGTWSQKYNLVWDRILGLDLFPRSVIRSEVDFYLRSQNRYGLPLDSRRDYTKLDWILWTATLTGERSDFDALVAPVAVFFDATPDRVPMTDWFRTKEPRKEGFQARSVVGGVFIKIIDDDAQWKKYAQRDPNPARAWAPQPLPPIITEVVPTSRSQTVEWKFTTAAPSAGWYATGFDASSWKTGRGGFGTEGTPGAAIGTVWNSPDIWLRREFELPAKGIDKLRLYIHHDEDAEIYLNGKLAVRLPAYSTRYEAVVLPRGLLKPGKNTVAVHCHQTGGGQYIDLGLVEVKEQDAGR